MNGRFKQKRKKKTLHEVILASKYLNFVNIGRNRAYILESLHPRVISYIISDNCQQPSVFPCSEHPTMPKVLVTGCN